MVLLLFLAGLWSRWAALAVAGILLLGLGGLAVDAAGEHLYDFFWTLSSVEFVHPWWILLLLLAPVSVLIAWKSLARFESVRPWIAVVLRTLGVILLALALAEPRLKQAGEHVTVLFVLDRSLSIPQDFGDEPGASGQVDRRAERIRRFINAAVEERGAGHARDRAGLIVFGKQPRLELPPSDAPRFKLTELPPARDANYTDIGAAIKMALASFPEDTAKRIVLISDGNENLGNAEEQAPPRQVDGRADRRGSVGRRAAQRGRSADRARAGAVAGRTGVEGADPRPRPQLQSASRRRQTHP